MGDDLIKYNPFGSFRVGQREGVQGIIDAYNNDAGVLEYSAPTGSGKTLCMVAAGRALLDQGASKVVYTTPLVALVDQIGRVKEYNMPTIVGKKNYPCLLREGMTADDCPFKANDIGDPEICPGCPYRQAKFDFLLSSYGATTMARFLFDPSVRKGTKVVMIDESATLEDALLRNCTLRIPESIDLAQADLPRTILRWSLSLEQELVERQEEYARTWGDLDKKPSRSALRQLQGESKTIKAMERDVKKCGKILHIINTKQRYFVDKDRNFKVIHGGQLFKEMAKDFKLVVLASGTPTTHLICEKYKKICAPHPIDVNRRRVYVCSSVGKMSKKCREATAPKMAKMIEKLHDKYHQNTIAHCGNYDTARLLCAPLQADGYHVLLQNKEDREGSLRSWKSRNDIIFLSVAFTNGIDLEGDAFPMNIIANMPYPNLGDEWVKQRKEYDEDKWYNTSVAVEVQQAAGRCTRTPTDFSQTWILDQNFVWFYKQHTDLFEPWFRESLMFVR